MLSKQRHLLLLLMFLSALIQAQQTDTSQCKAATCYCQEADASPAGVMISHTHIKHEWMFSYRYMTMNMGGVCNGNKTLNESDVLKNYMASPDKMNMQMHMIMGMYGISNKLTLMAMFQYQFNYMEMSMPMGAHIHHHSMSTAGLGDTKVTALYSIIKKNNYQLLFNLGINIPNGSINVKGEKGSRMYPDKRFPYNMQLGSGGWDLLPGINYLYQKEKLSFSSQMNAVIRTGKNTNGYHLGNQLVFNVWTAWQLLPFLNASLRLEALQSSKIKGRDTSINEAMEPAAVPSNYGGTRASAFAGISFQAQKSFFKYNRFAVEFGLPFYQNMNGTQMIIKNTLNFLWSLNF